MRSGVENDREIGVKLRKCLIFRNTAFQNKGENPGPRPWLSTVVNFTVVNFEQRFCKNYIYKIIIFGSDPRQTLPALPKDSRSETSPTFRIKRRQFSVRLCFAMTISKAQGHVNGPGSEPGKPVDRRGTVGEKVY